MYVCLKNAIIWIILQILSLVTTFKKFEFTKLVLIKMVQINSQILKLILNKYN